MRSNKCCIGLLICLALAIKKTESDEIVKEVFDVAIPAITTLLTMTVTSVPLGAALVGGLGFIHILSTLVTHKNDSPIEEDNLSTIDLLKSHEKIVAKIKEIDNHVIEGSSKIIRELSFTVKSNGVLEDLRNTLDGFNSFYADDIKVVLDSTITGIKKNRILIALLDPHSSYRAALKSFVKKFISPGLSLEKSGPANLFFDFLLEKERLLALEHEDCNTYSLHSNIFESFMLIAKIFTNGYVLPIAAHVVQFQNDIKAGRLSDATASKTSSEELINTYKNDMKILIEKAKWALEKSPRDIKNCGKFTNFKKGIDYDRISFTETLPIIRYIPMASDKYICTLPKELDVNRTVYETGMCDTYIRKPPISLSIYKNTNEADRPFKYMIVHSNGKGAAGEIFGHNNSDPFSSEIPYKTTVQCNTIFCIAFKKNAVAISTQPVRADPGNVITGLRFRIRKNVVYIDIQQGRYLDPISVDSYSVFWTETPESKQVQYLNSSIRGIELGDFEVDENSFLTTIQLQVAFRPSDGVRYVYQKPKPRSGFIKPYICGSTAPDWHTHEPYPGIKITAESYFYIQNEMAIKEGDDPEVIGAKVVNLISKAPQPNEPHFINFQPSDLKKDFGRTTCPYFDLREVVSYPPAPLSGFGIYHEAASGSCGFLALKLITPDLNHLIEYNQIEGVINFTKKT